MMRCVKLDNAKIWVEVLFVPAVYRRRRLGLGKRVDSFLMERGGVH